MLHLSTRRTLLAGLACSLLAMASASQALSFDQPRMQPGLQSPSVFPRPEPDQCFGEGRSATERPCLTWDRDSRRCRGEREQPRKGGRHCEDDGGFERPRVKEFQAACCVQPKPTFRF